jgi:hypothetical protein
MLTQQKPEVAEELAVLAQENVNERWEKYAQMAKQEAD